MSNKSAATLSAATCIDPQIHAAVSRATSSLAPTSTPLPMLDRAVHLMISPDRQLDLVRIAVAQAERSESSWWPQWLALLNARSAGTQAAPRRDATSTSHYPALGDAPGTYVMER